MPLKKKAVWKVLEGSSTTAVSESFFLFLVELLKETRCDPHGGKKVPARGPKHTEVKMQVALSR